MAEKSRQCLLHAGPSHRILSIRFNQNCSISGNKAWCSRWLIHLLHSLFFQNNLNLLRDIAVLIARDFKSKPVQSQLFVLHRYREFGDRGRKPGYYVIYGSCISDTYSSLQQLLFKSQTFLMSEYKQGEQNIKPTGPSGRLCNGRNV